MIKNDVLDFGIGLVPSVGDLFDALLRVNIRNAVVLEKYPREKGALKVEAVKHSRDKAEDDI